MAAAVGPGLVVMLADTEAGSVITAAQSGAQWGYRLLLLQFLIIPLLYTAQELSIRLGLGTGKGFGELVRLRFGRGIALLSLATLVLSCFGALVTELSGLAGIGELFGIPLWETVGVLVVLIFAMVCTGSYHGVERIAICLGLFGVRLSPWPGTLIPILGRLRRSGIRCRSTTVPIFTWWPPTWAPASCRGRCSTNSRR